MFNEFVNSFLGRIIKEGFIIRERESGIGVLGTANIVVAERRVGGAICVLTVMDADALSVLEIRGIADNMTKRLEEQLGNYFNTIYSIFVLAGESIAENVKEIIESGEVFERQKVYNIYWGVSFSDLTVHTNESQPSEMYGIRSCIDFSLSALKCADETDVPEDFISLVDLRANSGRLQVKSGNSLASFLLMASNIAIFAVMIILGANRVFWEEGAIIPLSIWENGEYYRLFTAMFLHANTMHIASNCLGIYIFGTRIEKYFGKAHFLIIYFAAGLLGSLFSLLFTRGMSIGASGAVYGLIGAVAVKSFTSRRELDGLSAYIIVIWIIAGFAMSVMVPGIDVFGHLGGLLGGVVLGYALSGDKGDIRKCKKY